MKHCDKENCRGDCCGLCCTRIESFGVVAGKNEILKDVNLHIHCGELTAIIGPNGAGKSTLLKALLGEVRHTGTVRFMAAEGGRSGTPVIGYVPQHLSFDSTAPTSVLDLFQSVKTMAPAWLLRPRKIKLKAEQCLGVVKAEHLLHRRLGALSGGELQRVLLALALSPVPDILLLDEPVSGIDPSGMALFYNIVSKIREEYDLSIILVSHDLDYVAKYADRVVFLNKTVEIVGSPKEVFSNERVRKTFGNAWFEGISLDAESANSREPRISIDSKDMNDKENSKDSCNSRDSKDLMDSNDSRDSKSSGEGSCCDAKHI